MEYESVIRVRMSLSDAHYGKFLVDGAKILSLFGDVATELLIRLDGDEGLFLTYEQIRFIAPVYAGDYIEARGSIKHIGNTSRRMIFQAYKVIAAIGKQGESTACEVLSPPLLVCEGEGVCVVPKDKQRLTPQ